MTCPERAKHRAYINETSSDLRTTIEAGLEFVRWDRCLNANSRVFVKPNFTFPYYKEGVTTNPALLRCLLQLLRARAGSVTVCESNGGNNSFTADEAFQGHGMREIGKDLGIELLNLSSVPSEVVEDDILGKRVRVQLPRVLLEDVDCFISVPVLKVHVMTTVTLSMKNLWGCYPVTTRCLHHQDLARKLALITKHLKPRMAVIDGTFALNRHGPMHGEASKRNLAIVSDNVVAADALGARVMGFSPQRIGHIAVAEKAGLGSTRLDGVILNQDWQKYQMQFEVNRTFVDCLSTIPFNNDFLARLIMASPLTSNIYRVVNLLKSPEEKEADRDMGNRRSLGVY